MVKGSCCVCVTGICMGTYLEQTMGYTLSMFVGDTALCVWGWPGGVLQGRVGGQGFLEDRRSDLSRTWRSSVGTNAKCCTWEGRATGRSMCWGQGFGEAALQERPWRCWQIAAPWQQSWPNSILDCIARHAASRSGKWLSSLIIQHSLHRVKVPCPVWGPW